MAAAVRRVSLSKGAWARIHLFMESEGLDSHSEAIVAMYERLQCLDLERVGSTQASLTSPISKAVTTTELEPIAEKWAGMM